MAVRPLAGADPYVRCREAGTFGFLFIHRHGKVDIITFLVVAFVQKEQKSTQLIGLVDASLLACPRCSRRKL